MYHEGEKEIAPEFWKLLGGKGEISTASQGGDDAEFENSILSICLFICLFVYFVYLFICLFGYLVIWLFGYLVIWLFVYLFICLFVYFSHIY